MLLDINQDEDEIRPAVVRMAVDLHEAVLARAASEERSMAQAIRFALRMYVERVVLENDLRRAVALRQFHLVYQPIVRLPQGPVEGVEALIRWSHATLGVLSPIKFIPLAEESGLITEIGAWVLEEAMSQLAAWRRQGPEMGNLYVSVNLSGPEMHDEHIVERVSDALTVHQLEGSALCLEVSESVVADNPGNTADALARLSRLGVRIAIDDFGTDPTALAYFKRFPVTTLKIDQSLVDSLAEKGAPDSTRVAEIVALAKTRETTTVAEGVEMSIQSERLIDLGCDAAQGYLYSRPVRADRFPELVSGQWPQGLQIVPS